jgi:hypothetical protein
MPKHRAAPSIVLLLALAFAGCQTGLPGALGTAGSSPCAAGSRAAGGELRAENISLAGQIGGELHPLQTLAARGTFVYATSGLRLLAIDAADPARPFLASQSALLGGTAYGVAIDGPYAFVSIGEAGVCIFDLADPARPRPIAALPAKGYVGAMVAQAGRLYYSESNYHRADYRTEHAVHIADVSDPARPVVLGRYPLPQSPPGFAGFVLSGLAASGARLYIVTANGQDTGRTVYVVDVADPARPALLGQLAIPGRGWGWNMGPPPSPHGLAVSGDTLYLPLRAHGLSIIDVSDPARPAQVGLLELEVFPNELALAGRWLYVTLQGYGAGGQALERVAVVDLAEPRRPVLTSASAGARVSAIAVAGDAIYAAAAGSGLLVLDRTNPSAPRRAGTFAWPSTAYDVAAAGGYAYLIAAEGLFALDVRDPAQIRVTAHLPGVRGTPAVSGSILYIGTDRSLETYQISNPAHPVALGRVAPDPPGDPDERTGVLVRGHYVYAGRQVFDVSDPAHPRRVATLPYGFGLAVTRGYAYIRDTVRPMLQIIDVSDPAEPRPVGSYPLASQMYTLAAAGDYLYVSLSPATLQVFDVRDGAVPVPRGQLGLLEATYLQAAGRLLVLRARGGLVVVDAANPDQPAMVAHYNHPELGNVRVAVDGPMVYVAMQRGGLQVLRLEMSAAGPLPTFTPVATDTPLPFWTATAVVRP